ncbi:MAG: hypothetical protein KIG95_02695 [Comamonas sp.]|nr:hypothetical protein [Comamonas sp.]
MGFKDAKSRVIKALENGDYSHEVRLNIDEKNKLQTGEVSADFVINIIRTYANYKLIDKYNEI